MLLIGSLLSLIILISMTGLLWQGTRSRPPAPWIDPLCPTPSTMTAQTTQVNLLEQDIAHATALVHLVTRHQVPIVREQSQQIRLHPLPTTTTDQLTDLCVDLTTVLPATTVVVDVTDLPRATRLPLAQHVITQLHTHGYQSLTVHGLDAVIPPILQTTTHYRN